LALATLQLAQLAKMFDLVRLKTLSRFEFDGNADELNRKLISLARLSSPIRTLALRSYNMRGLIKFHQIHCKPYISFLPSTVSFSLHN
jgi:hypothetical protein